MAQMIAIFLPLAMVVLMASLGLRLRLADLAATARAPRALGTGLVVQLLGLPLMAFLITLALGLPAPLAAGVMLVAASPGGVSSNYIAHLARGKVALSVAMTLCTSLAAPLTLPLVLAAAGATAPAPAALLRISFGMTLVAVAPLALGMAFAHFAPRIAATTERRLAPIAKALFALMVLATFAQNWSAMSDAFGAVGLAVGLLAIAAPGLALVAGRLMQLGAPERRTIAVEASLQNVAIAMFVAGPVLGQPQLAIPALIYALCMNLVALGLIAQATVRARAATTPL